MRFDAGPISEYDLSSLRVLGSVGEPINPEAWRWYFNNVGKGKCTVVSHLISLNFPDGLLSFIFDVYFI